MLRRTMLFMPGNNPGMLQTAHLFGADSVIFDLEDAVAITEKDSARTLVREALKNNDYTGTEVVIRINPLSTPFAKKDIEVMGVTKPHAILLPKASVEDMITLDTMLTKIELQEGFSLNSIKIHALVETAMGIETVKEIIQASERCVAVLLGGEDLAADLGVKRTFHSEEIFYARTRVVNACKAFKVDALDTPFTDTNHMEELKLDTEKAKNLGFSGKLAINPRQIEKIHEVFAPTPAEIRYALRVLDAKEKAETDGLGVFTLDGKMVDLPIINRAVNTLNIAKLVGLIDSEVDL